MIRIENLSKTFKGEDQVVHAVRDLSLNIARGDIYGIIGYSGAGKSTLLRCINRLEEPDQGKIFIDGLDFTSLGPKDLRRERKNIGMIFQHFNLLEQRTVYENIAFPLRLNGYPKDRLDQRVEELLSYVELEDKKDSYPSQLSGGQKQRVAIARAISNNPKILLSDEGTSALDPRTTQSILDLLSRINQDLGITIVMITHQMEVVKEICQKVAIMENGQLVEENTVENLFTQPKTRTANLFIDSLKGDVKEEIINPLNYQGRIVRLGFLGESANQPIIAHLIRQYDIDINILSGNINRLQMSNIGHLIVEFLGDDDEISRALGELEAKKIVVEVI